MKQKNASIVNPHLESPGSKAARGLIKAADFVVDLVVLALIMVLLVFAVYSICDTNQIYTSSEQAVFETYKPTEEENSPTFAELQALNPDVVGWISLYGTGVDYPVVIGKDNDEYMNKTVTGDFALGGSIFLDYTNARDFTDFNTIIYGHHMEKSEMFGDLDKFDDKQFFDDHKYGSLYYDGKLHGLTVFAMVDADAYDFDLYDPHVESDDAQAEYISYIDQVARYTRDIGVKPGDHLVMLSTCATGTNDRYVLFARIDDKVEKDPYYVNEKPRKVTRTVNETAQRPVSQERLILYLSLLAVVFLILTIWFQKRSRRKRER